jgi:hypothetical protein
MFMGTTTEVGGTSSTDYYGKWRLTVVSWYGNLVHKQFNIANANAGSGSYDSVTTGDVFEIEGPKWQIYFGWSLDGDYVVDAIFDVPATSYTQDRGLISTSGFRFAVSKMGHPFANDGFSLLLENIDPTLNPFVPLPPVPDFTYPLR